MFTDLYDIDLIDILYNYTIRISTYEHKYIKAISFYN